MGIETSISSAILRASPSLVAGSSGVGLTLPRTGLLLHARSYDPDAALILDRVGMVPESYVAPTPSGSVFYVSPSGSNTAPYDTWAKAANTISTASVAGSGGDTILIAPGTYPQSSEFFPARDDQIFRGAGDSPGSVIIVNHGHAGRTISTARPLTLENLLLRGTGSQVVYASKFVTFNDVIVEKPSGGSSISLWLTAGAGGSRLTLAGNHDSGGIRLTPTVDSKFDILVVVDIFQAAIRTDGGSADLIINNLTVNGCTAQAILKQAGHTGDIVVGNMVQTGNALYNNTQPIRNESTGAITISNSLTLPRPPNFAHLTSVTDGGNNIGLTEGSCLPIFTSTKYPIFLSFCIDDLSSLSFFEDFADLCEEFGYRATFALNTGFATSTHYATLAALINRGHEVAAHSVTHPNFLLDGLTPEQITAELVDSKAAIEAGLAAQGLTYTVKSFVPPGNANNQDTRDLTQAAGYEGARGATTYSAGSGGNNVHLITHGKVFTIFAEEGYGLGTTHIKVNTAAYLEFLGAVGGAACFYGHATTYGGSELTLEQWREMFEEVAKHPNVQVFTLGGLIQQLKSYDPNGDLTVLDNGHTYSRTLPDNRDLRLHPDSPCIGAGTSPFSDGDGDQYDAAGYKIWDDTTDLPDGHWVDGVDIGAYAFGGGERYYNHLTVVSGDSWDDFVVTVPADPALVAADTLGTLFTAGVPNSIDATARASMTGDQFFFHANKGLAVYDDDLTGTDLAKADKVFKTQVIPVPPSNVTFPYTFPFEVA